MIIRSYCNTRSPAVSKQICSEASWRIKKAHVEDPRTSVSRHFVFYWLEWSLSDQAKIGSLLTWCHIPKKRLITALFQKSVLRSSSVSPQYWRRDGGQWMHLSEGPSLKTANSRKRGINDNNYPLGVLFRLPFIPAKFSGALAQGCRQVCNKAGWVNPYVSEAGLFCWEDRISYLLIAHSRKSENVFCWFFTLDLLGKLLSLRKKIQLFTYNNQIHWKWHRVVLCFTVKLERCHKATASPFT